MRLLRTAAAGVLALAVSAPAFADPPRHSRGHDRGYERHYDHRDYRDARRDDRRDWRNDRRHYSDGYRDGRRDARHNKHWRKGDRFDARYTRHVVVHDYHRYHAPPPRHGQYYARTDTGELLLIAAATGLVIWALNN